MELIAASRIVKAQARVQAAAPVQRPDHRGRPRPRRRPAAGASSPLLVAAARDPQGRARRDRRRPRPVRRVQLVGDPRRGGARSREHAALGRDYALVARRPQGRGLLPLPQLPHRRGVHRLLATSPTLRGRARRSRGRRSRAFVAGELDLVQLVYTRFISAGPPGGRACGRCMPLDATRTSTADADAPTTRRPRRYEFEPTPDAILDRLLPRYVEARVYAALLERGRVGARRPPAGDEGRDRQRRRPDHQPHPRHEPRPPGLDHHRDHGDRRRRRGAAQRGRRRTTTSSPTPSSTATQTASSSESDGEPRSHHDCHRRHPSTDAEGRARRRDRRPGRRRRVPARRAARDQLRARDGRRARGRDDHDHRRGRAADRRQPRAGHLPEAHRRPAAAARSCATSAAASRCRSATACSATCST